MDNLFIKDDFPAPAGPVMPITIDLPRNFVDFFY
jgi:hypothetical protein